ncbi:alpha/beta fold hydrolase [Alloalcanivorax xenomutans]|uniref:Alpha/beta hydrolase n=1 Tax=Alloalcanivorax xenomutans TaxID=1094342 RepID=A0A9Q3W0Q2_9GAMM|nr:alpha/beta hydrolase [Alloalcanivorax xenomutans]MCE7508535.1 alpha/beta hydrolase [Alloalcanivorax xenomutans]PHS59950.1 MAG: alpha/beta hydrolase [Alcanivorax sp.]
MSSPPTKRVPEERRFSAYGQTLAALYWDGPHAEEEREPILALHGWLDNAASFLPLSAHLNRPMVALDFAGHGHSEHRPAELATHYVDHVRDVLAVADQLGWDRFVLMGHSMGAGVACLFAATFPERVSKLVLIEGLGPPATPANEVVSTLRTAIDQMHSLPEKRKPVYAHQDDAVAVRRPALGGLETESARLLCERGLVAVEGGWTWRTDMRLRIASSVRFTEEQVEGFVRAIEAPTLLILGENGLAGEVKFEHRFDWLRDARRVILPGRHHLHMDTPEPVAAEIQGFLAS